MLTMESPQPATRPAGRVATGLFLGGNIGRNGTSFTGQLLQLIVPDDVLMIGEIGVFPLEQIRGAYNDFYEAPPGVENKEVFLRYFREFVLSCAYDRNRIYGKHIDGFKRYVPSPDQLAPALAELSDLTRGRRSRREIAEAFGRFYSHALSVCAECTGRQRWISKDPGYGRYLVDLHRMLPDCRVLLLIRDPRDTISSMMRKGWDGGDASLCIRRWCDSTERTLQAIAATPPANVMLLRYERLVADPAGSMRRVLDFYGLEGHPSPERWAQLSAVSSTASVGKWKSELPADVARRVEVECAAVAERLGYGR